MRRVDEVQVNSVGSTCGRGYQNMPMLRPPECIFYLCIVVSLHDNPACIMLLAESEKGTLPAHHIKQIRQLQKTTHIWVNLDCQVLQFFLGWVDA